MWQTNQYSIGGHSRFFLANLSHESLVSYYKTNYQLVQNHKYSLTELENMIPWERDIYLTMLQDDIRKANDEAKKQQMQG